MKNNPNTTVLICDIGGTNVRFGLYSDKQKEAVVFDGKYKCADFSSFEEAIHHYLLKQSKVKHPGLCVVGAAGNIDEYNGCVLSTNTPWKANRQTIKEYFPFFDHIRLVNDFALQGWALGELKPHQYRSVFQNEGLMNLKQGKIVVLGPGTGLGTCLILQDAQKPQVIYTSEGGHSTIPYVQFKDYQDEQNNRRVLHIIMEHYEKNLKKKAVVESLVSGTGISNIYHALKDGKIPTDKSKKISSETIELLAQKGDPCALDTFKIFNAYFGAHAGTMATTTKANKIFFCGGLMASPWVLQQLEHTPYFKEQFEARANMTDAMKEVQFAASLYRDMSTLGAVRRAKQLIQLSKGEKARRDANRKILGSLANLDSFVQTYCPQEQRKLKIIAKQISSVLKGQSLSAKAGGR